MKFSIRDLQEKDIDRILQIEEESFAHPWSKDSLLFEIEQNLLAKYLVGEIDGNVVGYGGMWTIVDEGHITNIAVGKDHRHLGLGEKILQGLIDYGRSVGLVAMTLEVRVSNEPAKGLYSKLGFESVGIRPKYYSDNNEDAMIMWKTLEEM